ncbi:Gfo/Idh/MocA family protein [Phenylobacterium montanum]|uniref:Gfo/Idh/MocA family oxidoreductase n=1 Tax=Phenylobacterium montanum TaxID=2823693 RepID=A0A975IWG9_9CAUL|nr:Gfo/Idh/MocA family oxidoreductase [Caulobacter sp. S6]QUD88381.1 Gfo/Idh/MocA family oxidoreductase [Caulobacter sp. S6]
MHPGLKAGVAGAGAFGGHHARKYAGMAGVELVAVYDPDIDRARELAAGLSARGLDDLGEFLKAVDIVTVASPAFTHAAVALPALAAGKAVYVEKPIATTIEDADKIVAKAAEKGLVLACGLQERVVSRAMGLLDIPEKPLFLEAVRRAPWNPRNTDVSCVLDLMIHDIDLAVTLNPAEALAVEAEGRVTHGPFVDEVSCEITLGDGATVKLNASRIAEARERRMRIVYPSGEVEIDFISRAFRNSTPFPLNADFTETPAGRDPLGASVGAFVAAVKGEAPRPAATGAEAVVALDIALAVEQAAGF